MFAAISVRLLGAKVAVRLEAGRNRGRCTTFTQKDHHSARWFSLVFGALSWIVLEMGRSGQRVSKGGLGKALARRQQKASGTNTSDVQSRCVSLSIAIESLANWRNWRQCWQVCIRARWWRCVSGPRVVPGSLVLGMLLYVLDVATTMTNSDVRMTSWPVPCSPIANSPPPRRT